jgi:hypothetical protein
VKSQKQTKLNAERTTAEVNAQKHANVNAQEKTAEQGNA